MMLLTLGDGRVLANPTREVIEAALQTLEGGPGSFAIIEDDSGQTPDLFLQGTGGPDNFTVEYAEAIAEHGDEIEARHFRGRQQVMQETLAVMFESYALGDGTWKGMIPWEDTSTLPEEYDDEPTRRPAGKPHRRPLGPQERLPRSARTHRLDDHWPDPSIGGSVMRFGIILDGGNLPGESRTQALEDRLGKARRTRDFGYHSLWMGGGFLNNGWHASSLLARAAAEAQGLELGLLALLPLDHPVALAEQVSTLDAIAGGRLVLAASLGWRPHELQAFNIDRTERLPRFRESLEIMKLLWTQDRVTYQGATTTIWKTSPEPPAPSNRPIRPSTSGPTWTAASYAPVASPTAGS